MPRISFIKRYIPLISIGFLLLAMLFAHRQLEKYNIHHLGELVMSVPWYIMQQAVCISIAGYIIITFYDRLAMHYIHKKLPLRKTTHAAFIAFAISHSAGHPMVSGTSLRYRFYHPLGLSGLDAIKISAFDSLTYALGLMTLFLLAYGAVALGWAQVPVPGVQMVAMLTLGAYVAYWAAVLWWRPVVKIKGATLTLPHGKLSAAQVLMGSVDVILSGLVLHTFLATQIDIPLGEFYAVYVLALVLGTFSQVPGGLGVFEGLFIHMLSYHYPDVTVLPSLILYRIVYYFLPLGAAALMLLWHEANHHRLGLRLRILSRTWLRG